MEILRKEDEMSILAMDNNQRGERMKYQRGSKSSTCTLVTCMIAIEQQYNTCPPSTSIFLNTSARVPIKYIHQPIPSPLGMINYSSLMTTHS